MDPISTFVAAVPVVNGLLSSVKTALDLAKQSDNADVKNAVIEVYDAVLDVKNRVLDLEEENRQLKAKLTQKESISYDSQTQYFYKDGEDLPLCPKCYQGPDSRAVYVAVWDDGTTYCEVCNSHFYRAPKGRRIQPSAPLRVSSYDPYSY